MSLHAEIAVTRETFNLDVAFDAGPGEVLAILGPNGAGKSTLLRALAGLVPLGRGRVELGGTVLEDVAGHVRLAPPDRNVGMVFQDYRLFPHLSARENIAFGPRATGTPRADARRRADFWLDRLGLADLAGRRPHELSGGQAQRVALARALCPEPALLLLDEPLAALDVSTRADVRAELRRELATFAGPSLLVTHDPLEAMALADRLLVLEGGRIVQQGPALEIARRPATPYVARLVGLNLFRGTAVDGVVRVDGGGLLATADTALTGTVLAVARPSSITVHAVRPGPSSARNVWPGRLLSLEVLGDRVRAGVASTPPVLADITTEAVAELRLAAGDEVWVSLKAADVDTYPDRGPR